MRRFQPGHLLARLTEIYTGAPGQPLPPLRQLLSAEAAYTESQHAGRDQEYWRRRLADQPELVSLSEREFAPAQEFLRRRTTLSAETTTALRAVAAAANVTWPTVVVAATAAYTHG